MLDLTHFGQPLKNQQIIYANSITAGSSWITWTKPRNVNFLNIFLLGGGGGGGSSSSAGTVNNCGGGGGGGSGAQFNAIFNLNFLPDNLYISIGVGGAGGLLGTGSNGISSYVSIYPSTVANNILALANAGTGGSVGTSSSGGSGGSGGLASSISNLAVFGLAISTSFSINLAGQAGTAGGFTASGTDIVLPTTGLIVTGGAGGAGIASGAGNAGGRFIVPSNTIFPAHNEGLAGTATSNGGDGNNGYQAISKLLYFYGGTGGGSGGTSAVSNGGVGGTGFYGCGGGGGGGSSNGISGSGGNGGDGLCILTYW